MGKVNDLLFRGLMPYLVIVGIYVFYPFTNYATYRQAWDGIKGRWFVVIVYVLLVSSSFIAAGRIVRAMTINRFTAELFPEKVNFRPIPYDEYKSIYEVLKNKHSQDEADQYLGKKDSFYELKMAPKSH